MNRKTAFKLVGSVLGIILLVVSVTLLLDWASGPTPASTRPDFLGKELDVFFVDDIENLLPEIKLPNTLIIESSSLRSYEVECLVVKSDGSEYPLSILRSKMNVLLVPNDSRTFASVSNDDWKDTASQSINHNNCYLQLQLSAVVYNAVYRGN